MISILLVDDDERLRERLAKALAQRGFEVLTASGHAEALAIARSRAAARATDRAIDRAIVDLRMPGLGGLDVVRDLRALLPSLEVVVVTGYGSIATAVEAMRLGARDYLTKPAHADRILAAFDNDSDEGGEEGPPPSEPTYEVPSLARVEWEHIERVLRECNGNISKTARVLGMHRRTLQYKLAKFPVSR